MLSPRKILYPQLVQPILPPPAPPVDGWVQPLSQPVLPRPITQPEASGWPPLPMPGTDDIRVVTVSHVVPFERTMQYPSLIEPVQFTTPETITVDKWLAPLSEPTRRRGQPTFEQESLFFVGSDTARDARWFTPLSEPVRWRGLLPANQPYYAFVKAAPFEEAVSIDKWQQPLAEPVRLPLRLSTANQPYLSFVKADPFPEAVTADRWFQPLSEPIRIKGALAAHQQATFFVGSDSARDAWWFSPLSEPVRRKPTIQPDAAVWAYFAPAGEVVTIDKWFAPASEPVRRPSDVAARPSFFEPPTDLTIRLEWFTPFSEPVRWKGLRPHHQQALAFHPTPVTVAGYHWFQPLSEPVRWRGNHPSRLPPLSLHPNPVTVAAYHWQQPLSQPVRRIPFTAHQHPALSFHPTPITVAAYQWQQPLSEPVRRKPTVHPDALAWSTFVPAPKTDWIAPLSEPRRFPRRAVEFPALHWSYYTPPSTEVVTVDKYFQWFAEPVRFRRGTPVYLQPYAYFVKAAPFGENITPDKWFSPLSVPRTLSKPGLLTANQPVLAFVDFSVPVATIFSEYIIRARRRGRR